MSGKLLGIDIGTGAVKLTDGTDWVISDTPDHVFDNDNFIAYDGMSEMLRNLVKENGIRTKKAALVIPDNEIYFTRTTMPFMTEKQLKVNLPYELSGIIGKEKDSYIYDYALVRTVSDDKGTPKEMVLLVAAIRRSLMERYTEMIRKAGLRPVKAMPRRMAVSQVLSSRKGDMALVDIGYSHTRIDMYRDGMFDTGRVLDFGVRSMTDIASELLFCDSHIALEYLKNNKDDIIHHQKMKDLYDFIAVEIMRAINYYTYENRDNTLETLYYYGGGSAVTPLIETIRSTVDLDVKPISDDENVRKALAAYGASQG